MDIRPPKATGYGTVDHSRILASRIWDTRTILEADVKCDEDEEIWTSDHPRQRVTGRLVILEF